MKKPQQKHEPYDIIYALNTAAELMDDYEFPDDTGAQNRANKEAARIIRGLANRRIKKWIKP